MGAKRNTDLTVSVGMHVYMAIPERGSIGPGHVCIMPVEHTPSFRAADDDVYEELKNFQKCLMQMYEAEVGPKSYHIISVMPGIQTTSGAHLPCRVCPAYSLRLL